MESCWKWMHWILAIDWWFPDELSSGWFTEPSLSQVFRAGGYVCGRAGHL